MVVKKAGCILLDVKNRKVGLVYRQNKNDYSFPKGHLELGETLEECAVRETEEETGRKCSIISSITLPTLKYLDSKGCATETYCYLALDEGKSDKDITSELKHDLVWLSIERVEKVLSYQNLIDFWKEIKHLVYEVIENEEC